MHLDLANGFLKVLHQFAEETGYSSYASAEKIGEYLGATDRQKIRNVVKLLETRGLIRVIWLREPQVSLSEEGALFLESGNALADPSTLGDSVRIDQSTHFHGSVSGSAINVRSTGGAQSVTNGTDAEAIIGQIISALKADQTLSTVAREDHIIDAENLGRELKKNQPNKGLINAYLSNLGSIASIARLVVSIVALL